MIGKIVRDILIPFNALVSQMSRRFPLKSVFETSTKPQMEDESNKFFFAAAVGALFMVACFYAVFFLGWNKGIVTFVSPLGVAVPCALCANILSKAEGETGKARIVSLAMWVAGGYVGGQILMAIFVLAWHIVG